MGSGRLLWYCSRSGSAAGTADVPLDILQVTVAGRGDGGHDLGALLITPNQMLPCAVESEPFGCHEGLKVTGHGVSVADPYSIRPPT